MYKLLIFASLLILLNCGRETKDEWYFAKKEFKRTKNPNYKNYFPQVEITKQADKKDEIIKKMHLLSLFPLLLQYQPKKIHLKKKNPQVFSIFCLEILILKMKIILMKQYAQNS